MQVQKENFDSEMKSRAAEIAAKDRLLLLPAPMPHNAASAADHKAICARASPLMLTAAMQNNREPVQESVRVEQPADKPCVRGAHDDAVASLLLRLFVEHLCSRHINITAFVFTCTPNHCHHVTFVCSYQMKLMQKNLEQVTHAPCAVVCCQ